MSAENIQKPVQKYAIDDETLRDGVQAPYVLQPTIEQALTIFEFSRKLGVQKADIGFAASSPTTFNRIKEVAKQNYGEGTPITISCAARTTIGDIDPIIKLSQEIGNPIEADTFIGTDPLRMKVEGWTPEFMANQVEQVTRYAIDHGVPTMLVTETSFAGIQQIPNVVRDIYLAGLNAGAGRVCLCDTTGAHTFDEIIEGIHWMRNLLDTNGFHHVGIDFHGHDDLTNAVSNSVAAFMAGADRVHATILGIGERRGNTDLIPLLVQLDKKEMNSDHNLHILPEYAMYASSVLGVPISDTHPVIGPDARCMVSGVHATAALKGLEQGHKGIYLPFDPDSLGIKPSHTTKIGQMAGKGNVLLFALMEGLPRPTDLQIERVLNEAKGLDQRGFLSPTEIKHLLSY